MTVEGGPVRTVDRAGFTRRWGVHIGWTHGAAWVSLGFHFDWHTPTVDIFVGRGWIQIGKNNWDGEGRWSVSTNRSDGHTDQCTHFREVRDGSGTRIVEA